jgi:multiple sugar transport system permease protein
MSAATTTKAPADQAGTRTAAVKKDERPKTPWWMWLAVGGIVFYCLFPFYWLINLSLKTGADLADNSLIPPNPSLDNYQAIFRNDDFVRALGNSVWVAGWTTVLAIIIGSFCAYALARLRFKGKFFILGLVLAITTFPGIAIAAPLFRLWSNIGMATAAILVFIGAWNEFLFAITLTSTPQARTVPAAIAFFTGATTFDIPIGTITAASVVISVPLIVMVLLFQKRIVAGLTAGAVKG